MNIRVKICGITRPVDGIMAAHAGADALGLVFYPPSPRGISIEQAVKIVYALPPFITTVGLFVSPEPAEVWKVLEAVPLNCIQFHGDEAPAFCDQFKRPYIKALRMQPGMDVAARIEEYPGAAAVLLDTFVEGVAGGTGQKFDWGRVPRVAAKPVILAGGLTPENVAQAVAQVRPYAVDVSGGVELQKGIKDPERVKQFIKGAKSGI